MAILEQNCPALAKLPEALGLESGRHEVEDQHCGGDQQGIQGRKERDQGIEEGP